VDPLAVLSAGFWLSFAGVGWLMWCLPGSVGTGAGGAGRTFVRAQAVALVGLLPLTVWFFGQASLPGPVANLVAVPVISLVVVPLALAGIVMWPLHAGLAAEAWQASATVMDATWRMLETIAAWPSALAWFPEPSLPALGLACVGAAWWLLPSVVPDRGLALLLFLPLLWPATERPAFGEVDVQVLDVGQGLSVLVTTHSHRLLYDTGAAGSHAALLPGDIGAVVQRRLVALHGPRLAADLVVAPRHGAADGADGAFIAAVAPRWAVFSTGAGNRGGLPKPEALDAWQRAGVSTLDTARTGSLWFRLTPRGARLREARRADRPRYWREPAPPGSGYATGQATADR
jgi:competence protein ComEC